MDPVDVARSEMLVHRTARVCSIGGGGNAAPGEVWIACHGYRQLAHRFIRRFVALSSEDRLIVAPEALSRFYLDNDGGRHGAEARVGATWMTREDRENEIRDYVRYLDAVWSEYAPAEPDPATRRVAFGFSQGVHTATRWAMLGEVTVDRLILWGAYVPPDLDLHACADRWSQMQVIQVHGAQDGSRSARLAEEQAVRLQHAGLEVLEYEHPGGHEIEQTLLRELAS